MYRSKSDPSTVDVRLSLVVGSCGDVLHSRPRVAFFYSSLSSCRNARLTLMPIITNQLDRINDLLISLNLNSNTLIRPLQTFLVFAHF